RPGMIANARIGLDSVSQQWLLFLSNKANLVLADFDPAVLAIQMCIATRAGLEFEGLSGRIEGPNSSEGDIEVLNHPFAAALKHRLQFCAGVERDGHLGGERGHAHPLLE